MGGKSSSGTKARISTKEMDGQLEVATETTTTLLALTKESPLLLVGTVVDRRKIKGMNAKGAWELLRIDVRGVDGRVLQCLVNNEATAPALGVVVAMPVFVGANGGLREARPQGEAF